MRALIKGDEVIIVNDRADPFVVKHLVWMQTQGYTLVEDWEPPTNDEQVPQAVNEVTETVTETAAAEETVTINGKTYTKSELKKLLE